MTLQDDFEQALRRLRDWHADSVKAASYDGDRTSQSKPGAVELKLQPYPHESYWRNRWNLAKGEDQQRRVVNELDKEYERLSRREKTEGNVTQVRYWLLESGSFYGVEYRQAASELGLETRTVLDWRRAKGMDPRTGKPVKQT